MPFSALAHHIAALFGASFEIKQLEYDSNVHGQLHINMFAFLSSVLRFVQLKIPKAT